MRVSPFTHDFLLLFSGPIVWAAHFLTIYGWIGVLCAHGYPGGTWLDLGLPAWSVLLASTAAAAAIAAIGLRARSRAASPDNRRFVLWMTRALAALSLLAIAWETLTVFLVPAC